MKPDNGFFLLFRTAFLLWDIQREKLSKVLSQVHLMYCFHMCWTCSSPPAWREEGIQLPKLSLKGSSILLGEHSYSRNSKRFLHINCRICVGALEYIPYLRFVVKFTGIYIFQCGRKQQNEANMQCKSPLNGKTFYFSAHHPHYFVSDDPNTIADFKWKNNPGTTLVTMVHICH